MCHRIRQTRKYNAEARAWVSVIVNDPCAYCGTPLGGTVDHIMALTRGGSDDWTNLTGACSSCNARKRTIPLLQFMLRRVS
ncbi:MAG: HNH endonuclease [Pseudonocardia sp.]|nr:HNH endonuclease [Pseudonocardia sp.]